jgi:hypothetical protein
MFSRQALFIPLDVLMQPQRPICRRHPHLGLGQPVQRVTEEETFRKQPLHPLTRAVAQRRADEGELRHHIRANPIRPLVGGIGQIEAQVQQ